jgi:TIR domain
MPKIAISYRRADSSAITGRIFDRLAAHYGENSVFMDIDNIPLGVDFRRHIQNTLQHTDVLVAVIGTNWLGLSTDGAARMNEKTDPVRVEIETALKRNTTIIPVLVDGAKMPNSADLPAELGNFTYLNAAEFSSGRDFHTHVDRLIGAIDQILAPEQPGKPLALTTRTRGLRAEAEMPVRNSWRSDLLYYVAAPLILLLVVYYIILINNFDNIYIWLAATAIPFVFGFAFSWIGKRQVAPTIAVAVALGLLGVSEMTTTGSMISGDPILPHDRFEWLDNLQFAGVVTLSFLAGHLLARTARMLLPRKLSKM